jgi:hypothetical protein
MPLPQLLYAQVVKTVRRRLVRVWHRVVFGTLEAVQQVLAVCGWQINTSFVERINLTIRQHVAAVGRRVTPCVRASTGYASSCRYSRHITTFVCPMRAYANPFPSPCPPRVRAPRSTGAPVHPQWQPG